MSYWGERIRSTSARHWAMHELGVGTSSLADRITGYLATLSAQPEFQKYVAIGKP